MLVHIDSLQLSRGGVRILHDVHLSLEPGEIYGLLGPNGAGKSTSVAAPLGLLNADSGEVRLFDRKPILGDPAIYARIGVLAEQNGFYDWMTGQGYLVSSARLYGHSPATAELRDRLAVVGLEPQPGQRIGTFSRGMR